MKKIIIYGVILGSIMLLGLSAYKEATKSGIKSTRLPCFSGLTVFEQIHSPKLLKKLNKEGFDLKTSLRFIPSTFQTSKLFQIISKEEIEDFAKAKLSKETNSNYPLYVKVMVLENDTLDPNKKNRDAKPYLGYVRASFYFEDILIYQVQIDFLKPEDIAPTLSCIKESFETILKD